MNFNKFTILKVLMQRAVKFSWIFVLAFLIATGNAKIAMSEIVEFVNSTGNSIGLGWLMKAGERCVVLTPRHVIKGHSNFKVKTIRPGSILTYSGHNSADFVFDGNDGVTIIHLDQFHGGKKISCDVIHHWYAFKQFNTNEHLAILIDGDSYKIEVIVNKKETIEFKLLSKPNGENLIAGKSGSPIYAVDQNFGIYGKPVAFFLGRTAGKLNFVAIRTKTFFDIFNISAPREEERDNSLSTPISEDGGGAKGDAGTDYAASSHEESSVNDARACDRLAASPSDPFRASDWDGEKVKGKTLSELTNNWLDAWNECDRAEGDYKDNLGRYRFLKARVLMARYTVKKSPDRLSEIRDYLWDAIENGYPYSGSEYFSFLRAHSKDVCSNLVSKCINEGLALLKRAIQLDGDWANYSIAKEYTISDDLAQNFYCRQSQTCGDTALKYADAISSDSPYAKDANLLAAFVLGASNHQGISLSLAKERSCGGRDGCRVEGWHRFLAAAEHLPKWANRLLARLYRDHSELGVANKFCADANDCMRYAFKYFSLASKQGDKFAKISLGRLYQDFPEIAECGTNDNKAKCNAEAVQLYQKSGDLGWVQGRRYHVWTLLHRNEGTLCNWRAPDEKCPSKIFELVNTPEFDSTSWGKELTGVSLMWHYIGQLKPQENHLCKDEFSCQKHAFALFKAAAIERNYSKYQLGQMYAGYSKATDCDKENCIIEAASWFERSAGSSSMTEWANVLFNYFYSHFENNGTSAVDSEIQKSGERLLNAVEKNENLSTPRIAGSVFSLLSPKIADVLCSSYREKCKNALQIATNVLEADINQIEENRYYPRISALHKHCYVETFMECGPEAKRLFRALARKGDLETQTQILYSNGGLEDLCHKGDNGCEPGSQTVVSALKKQDGDSLYQVFGNQDLSIDLNLSMLKLAEQKGSIRAGVTLGLRKIERLGISSDRENSYSKLLTELAKFQDFLDPKFSKSIRYSDRELVFAVLYANREIANWIIKHIDIKLAKDSAEAIRFNSLGILMTLNCVFSTYCKFDEDIFESEFLGFGLRNEEKKDIQRYFGADPDGKLGLKTNKKMHLFVNNIRAKFNCPTDQNSNWGDCPEKLFNHLVSDAKLREQMGNL